MLTLVSKFLHLTLTMFIFLPLLQLVWGVIFHLEVWVINYLFLQISREFTWRILMEPEFVYLSWLDSRECLHCFGTLTGKLLIWFYFGIDRLLKSVAIYRYHFLILLGMEGLDLFIGTDSRPFFHVTRHSRKLILFIKYSTLEAFATKSDQPCQVVRTKVRIITCTFLDPT